MQMVSQFNKNTILAQMHILSYPQGDPVFYYLGVRVEGQQPLEIHLWQNKKGDNNFHAQFEGRTLADLTKAKNDGKTIFYDGFTVCLSLSLSLSHMHTHSSYITHYLQDNMLMSYHQHTQYLFSQLQPKVTKSEKRHKWIPEDENPRIHRYKLIGSGNEVEERKGVLHLVHAWIMQAQKKKVYILSFFFYGISNISTLGSLSLFIL